MSLRSRTKVKGLLFFSFFYYILFYHETKSFLFCSYCLIGDYAQNLELPHFGAEQPHDIYYFSALTVNIFGLADVTKFPTTMHAYGYLEDKGGKGGNNVASLLIKGVA
jgi:hypothetical protein